MIELCHAYVALVRFDSPALVRHLCATTIDWLTLVPSRQPFFPFGCFFPSPSLLFTRPAFSRKKDRVEGEGTSARYNEPVRRPSNVNEGATVPELVRRARHRPTNPVEPNTPTETGSREARKGRKRGERKTKGEKRKEKGLEKMDRQRKDGTKESPAWSSRRLAHRCHRSRPSLGS